MNWKKIALFLLFSIIGFGLFYIISIRYISWFFPIFFVAFALTLGFLINQLSKTKLIMLILILFTYLLIMIIKFPICHTGGFIGNGSTTQDCTCVGLEKKSWGIMDASWSQCVGIRTEVSCYEHTFSEEGPGYELIKQEIPFRSCRK